MDEFDPHEISSRELLIQQFEIAWSLAWYHLESLTTEECLWRPAPACLQVRQEPNGSWRADWPEREDYDIGPPTIGWTTWHIGYWWRKALDHVGGVTSLTHESVSWPGSAEGVRAEIHALRNQWLALLRESSENAFHDPSPSSWPLPDSSLQTIAAWLNLELMKNAAEIGLVRFLHAAQPKA